jgi:hypothetical protein
MSQPSTPNVPRAHEDLFQTVPSPGAQAQLTDYTPSLPEPAHDVTADLTADPMEDRSLRNAMNKLREGTIVTLNTAIQGVVAAVGEVDPHDLWYSPKAYSPTIATIEVFNPTSVQTIHLVQDGKSYDDSFTLFYQRKNGKRTDVKHCVVSNEDNLKDEIDINLYEAFKQHIGSKALRFNGETTEICELNDAEDGVVWYNASPAREKKLKVTGSDTYTWYLPATDENAARNPTILKEHEPAVDDEAPLLLGTDDGFNIDAEQETALKSLLEHPIGSYKVTDAGFAMELSINELAAMIPVASPETTNTALPAVNEVIDSDSVSLRAPSRAPPGGKNACVTNIIGIGDATAASLSGAQYNPSKSRSKVREQFEASEIDNVRELSEDEISDELQEAQANFEPRDTVDRESFITISEFIDDGCPLYETSGAYFSRAVADLRAYFEAHSNLTQLDLLQIHAGATNARLFDETGDKIGVLPELMFGQFGIEDVHTAVSWDGHSNDSPLPQPDKTEFQYALTRSLTDSLDINGRTRWIFAPDTQVSATGSGVTENSVTFHNADEYDDLEAALENGDVSAATVPSEVAEYVNALFNIDLSDDQTVEELVTVDDDNGLFIDHPGDLDVTFAAFLYNKYEESEDDTDEDGLGSDDE